MSQTMDAAARIRVDMSEDNNVRKGMWGDVNECWHGGWDGCSSQRARLF